MRNLLLAAAAAVSFAAPASAEFVVTVPMTTAIPASNDFQSQLNALGLDVYASFDSSITLDRDAVLTFEFLGSESGFVDTFTTEASDGSTITFTQDPDTNRFADPVTFGSGTFSAGLFAAVFTSNFGLTAPIGTEGFGIFLPRLTTPGSYTSNVLYFGYDNQITNDDDNHDDLVIRVTAVDTDVPAPASLALFGLGLGLVAAARRR